MVHVYHLWTCYTVRLVSVQIRKWSYGGCNRYVWSLLVCGFLYDPIPSIPSRLYIAFHTTFSYHCSAIVLVCNYDHDHEWHMFVITNVTLYVSDSRNLEGQSAYITRDSSCSNCPDDKKFVISVVIVREATFCRYIFSTCLHVPIFSTGNSLKFIVQHWHPDSNKLLRRAIPSMIIFHSTIMSNTYLMAAPVMRFAACACVFITKSIEGWYFWWQNIKFASYRNVFPFFGPFWCTINLFKYCS